MKRIKKVSPIEVKRTFVISDYVRWEGGDAVGMRSTSAAVYQKHLAKAKKLILPLSERTLDLIIAGAWKKRAELYRTYHWYLAEASTREIGAWKRAGGLPLTWTKRSLAETGAYVAEALKTRSKRLKHRSKSAIEGIIRTSLPYVQKEKFLYPIAFSGGTGTKGRAGVRKMKADLDDGNMRAIALAVSGKKKIKVYFGVPKKKSRT